MDKHSLDFNLKGDLCPVVDKDDKARVVTDTVTFTNTENKKRYFYVAIDPSPKWEITVTPMKGEVQSKKTQTFTVTLRVFLSTKVKSFIDVFFSDNKTTAKEAMEVRLNKTPDNKKRDAYPITMIIHLETIFSPRLDLDEVEEKERIGRGGNGEVWKVIWRNSEYALKKFRSEDMLPEERQMIDREITLMRFFFSSFKKLFFFLVTEKNFLFFLGVFLPINILLAMLPLRFFLNNLWRFLWNIVQKALWQII